MTKDEASQLGSEWRKDDKHRFYFDDVDKILSEYFGLELTRYKSGSISQARLDGEKISNSKAYKMIPYKIYFDAIALNLVIVK